MKTIHFPKSEIEELKKRLNQNKTIFTIRVSKEYGKYKKDEILKTDWKDKLKVLDLIKVKGIDDLEKKYLHFKEAKKSYPKEFDNIKKYQNIDILELKKIDSNDEHLNNQDHEQNIRKYDILQH